MTMTLGVDIACRAAHQASLARADGTMVWAGRRFFTTPKELSRLWADLDLDEPGDLMVVMELGPGWYDALGRTLELGGAGPHTYVQTRRPVCLGWPFASPVSVGSVPAKES